MLLATFNVLSQKKQHESYSRNSAQNLAHIYQEFLLNISERLSADTDKCPTIVKLLSH